MKNMKYLIGFLLLSTGCMDVVDFYLGIPLQPVADEDGFIPGLNLFGIIRPDSTGEYNNSFILLQKVIPAIGSNDSLDIGTAIVWVEELNGMNSRHDFLLTDHNHVFSEKGYRPDKEFRPKAGDRFFVECAIRELPVLTATTIVPNAPVLLMHTLRVSDNSLSFEIQADTTIFMLDVYVYKAGGLAAYQRLPGEQGSNTLVLLSSLQSGTDSIDLYGYDEKMATYYMTANTSLNFNKYRESFSTVENGYGVFGAMNHARFYLPE